MPVTTMEKQTVQVPTTEMERFSVSKPVTKTREVPETVRDVEMRCASPSACYCAPAWLKHPARFVRSSMAAAAALSVDDNNDNIPSLARFLAMPRALQLRSNVAYCRQEEVTREEVVIDKEMVSQPTTVTKDVKTEVPEVIEKKLVVPQVHEEMRRITVRHSAPLCAPARACTALADQVCPATPACLPASRRESMPGFLMVTAQLARLSYAHAGRVSMTLHYPCGMQVVRPRVTREKVMVKRPVEVTRKVKGTRPVPVKRKVKTSMPVRVVDMVNVTQPELTDYSVDVQVQSRVVHSLSLSAYCALTLCCQFWRSGAQLQKTDGEDRFDAPCASCRHHCQ